MSQRPVMVAVSQGSVHVNQVWLERAAKHVLVFQADLRDKYANISACGGGAEELSIMLCPEEGSADEVPTQITFTGGFDSSWQIAAEVVRYTLTVLLFRPTPKAEVVWRDDNPVPGEANG